MYIIFLLLSLTTDIVESIYIPCTSPNYNSISASAALDRILGNRRNRKIR
jgi:small basic protein